MFRRFSADFAIISMLVDGAIVSLALELALTVSPYLHSLFPFVQAIPVPVTIPGPLFWLIPSLWVLNFLIHSVYDNRRNFRVVDEMSSLVTGSMMAAISVFGLLFLTYRDVSRQVILFGAVVAFIATSFLRVFYRLMFRLRSESGVKCRRVVVAGTGPIGMDAAAKVMSFRRLGLSFQGYLDDRSEKFGDDSHVLGLLSDARSVILKNQVDDLVLALPRHAFEQVNQLVSDLHDLPVKVWVIPDYYSIALNRAHVEELAGFQMIDLRAPALDDYQRTVKRAFDICITLLMMPVALLVMGVIAMCIRLDSPGPILFRQKRVGENRRIFEMFKFRSMIAGAEQYQNCIERVDQTGKLFQDKRQKDPRITRIGAFIRKTSLDELPQLFNVLRGEMSLVGPRPEMPYLVDQYEPWQRKRFAVPQGITGWWQVNGRADKPMALHTEEDIYYVQNYSIWLDIQILVKTFFVVLRRKGAY